MNKHAIVISAVLVVALAGCKDEANTKKCSADCNGQLTNTWCPYYGAQYTGGTMACSTVTCTLDDSHCETGTTVGEFEFCSATNVECDSGLVCYADWDDQVCVTDCETDPDVCDADEYCDTFWFGSTATSAACWPTSFLGDACLPFSDGCSIGTCEPTNTLNQVFQTSSGRVPVYASQCTETCPGTEIGLGTSCTTDYDDDPTTQELCLDSGWSETQKDGTGESVACPGGDTDCDQGNAYACTAFADGDYCARLLGYCGSPVSVNTDFTKAFLDPDPPAQSGFDAHCDEVNLASCGGLSDASADAYVECAPFGSGLWVYPDPASASGYKECPSGPSDCLMFSVPIIIGGTTVSVWVGATCVSARDNQGRTFDLCSRYQSLCAAFCDDRDDPTARLTCPSGQVCGYPEVEVGDALPQLGGSEPSGFTRCPSGNTDCDQANGFRCEEYADGFWCVRPRMVCMTP